MKKGILLFLITFLILNCVTAQNKKLLFLKSMGGKTSQPSKSSFTPKHINSVNPLTMKELKTVYKANPDNSGPVTLTLSNMSVGNYSFNCQNVAVQDGNAVFSGQQSSFLDMPLFNLETNKNYLFDIIVETQNSSATFPVTDSRTGFREDVPLQNYHLVFVFTAKQSNAEIWTQTTTQWVLKSITITKLQ